MLLNCGAREDSGESWWGSTTLATRCEEPAHWKRPWCWERLRAGGEGGDRGWDGWMASLTQWARTRAKSLSRAWLFVTPCIVAHQAPLSIAFSRQECWRGLPFPSPEDLPNPGIKTGSLTPPALTGWFFTTRATREAPEFEQTQGDSERQGSLACCSPWGRK